jgi:hypothetical protein
MILLSPALAVGSYLILSAKHIRAISGTGGSSGIGSVSSEYMSETCMNPTRITQNYFKD